MLIVNINTLETVNLLNFGNDVVLNGMLTVNCKNITRIDRTFCKRLTCCNSIAGMNLDLVAVWYRIVFFLTCFITLDDNITGLFDLFHTNCTCSLSDDSSILRTSAFKEFFNTRKTLCNIFCRCDTTCMEGSHCKLCTRFTDRLGSDYTDSFTNGNKVIVSKVSTVALSAYAVLSLTVKN